MKKEAKDKHFIKKPIYEGGPQAMKAFIRKNLRYPEEALKNKVEGTVYVKYDIDYKGKVVDAKVISGLGHGCDEEAVRLVKLFEFSVPKNPRKLKIVFHKNIQIHFRLPKKKKNKAQQFQINYISTPAEKKAPNPSKKENGGGYTITIPFN